MQAVDLRTVAAVSALTMLVCIVAIAGSEPLRGPTGHPTAPPPRPADVGVTPPPVFPVPGALPPEVFVVEPEEEFPPAWLRWAVAAIGLMGILAAGALLVRELRRWGARRRRHRRLRQKAPAATVGQRPDEDIEDDAELARRAVDLGLARLAGSSDPRAAVIEAYAGMEQVLAERRLGRRTPEAPREYLGRVLRQQGMPERSLTTLTALFEEARFSHHPISESAPRRAISELESARRALDSSSRPMF